MLKTCETRLSGISNMLASLLGGARYGQANRRLEGRFVAGVLANAQSQLRQ
jgi:hypothetical protein